MSARRLLDGLQTDRLILRRWLPSDAAALNEAIAASLEHLRPWMPWVAFEPLSITDRQKLIEEWETQWLAAGDVVVGIWFDGLAVGGSGLHQRIGDGGLEIGYWIHSAYTLRGFATEAVKALTTGAFEDVSIGRVEIHHDKGNVASAAVPRSLGYKLVREQANAVKAPGEIGIECIWRVTRQQWRSGS